MTNLISGLYFFRLPRLIESNTEKRYSLIKGSFLVLTVVKNLKILSGGLVWSTFKHPVGPLKVTTDIQNNIFFLLS